jgi:hypothetical protein
MKASATPRVRPLCSIGSPYCHILETGNDSFRFKASAATAQARKEKPNAVTKPDHGNILIAGSLLSGNPSSVLGGN